MWLVFAIVRKGAFMRPSIGWVGRLAGLLGLFLALAGGVRPAAAAAPNIFVGQTITIDGLKMDVTSCVFKTDSSNVIVGSGLTSVCDVSGHSIANFAPTTSRGAVLNVISKTAVNNADSANPLFALVSANTMSELRFDLLVHATATAPVSFAQLSELTSAGTVSSTGTALVTEATLPAGFSPTTLSVSQTAAGTLGAFASTATAFTADFTVTVDLSLTSTVASGLQLTSAKIIFNPAPEPIAASVFLVGLTGLGAMRRRRAKARAAA